MCGTSWGSVYASAGRDSELSPGERICLPAFALRPVLSLPDRVYPRNGFAKHVTFRLFFLLYFCSVMGSCLSRGTLVTPCSITSTLRSSCGSSLRVQSRGLTSSNSARLCRSCPDCLWCSRRKRGITISIGPKSAAKQLYRDVAVSSAAMSLSNSVNPRR